MAIVFRIVLVVSVITLVAARIRIVQAGRNGIRYPAVKNGFEFCPPKRGMSFECLAPNWVGRQGVMMSVNGRRKIESNRPYFAGGDRGNFVYAIPVPYGRVVVRCWGKNFYTQVSGMIRCSNRGGKRQPRMPTPVTPPKGFCVAVKGTSFIGRLRRGWKRTGGTGVTFRPNSKFGGVVQPNYSVLTYKFRVPVAATYGIVVDMGTKHPTEHNDIWLKCDGGFTLWLYNSRRSANGFVKVYHNANGRRKMGVTIDFKGYSLSTQQMYYPGRTYTCKVGARSTMTTVYGILAFPCKGSKCQHNSRPWERSLRKCNV